MGFFSSKPRVSREEFKKKVRMALYNKNFTGRELDQLEGFFGGDLYESGSSQSGIDAKEVDRGVAWMKENRNRHSFSPEQIDLIENTLRKYL